MLIIIKQNFILEKYIRMKYFQTNYNIYGWIILSCNTVWILVLIVFDRIRTWDFKNHTYTAKIEWSL